MKIQLKRSDQLVSGKAKEPTEAQMEYGELAVNFNDADPAIFIKDSDNNIIRIGGVGNIADDGQTEIPSGPNPPLNPQPGNFWYNSEDGRLYYYYEDANSSQWVDASPDSQSNPVESGETFPATALPDDLFFNTTDGRLYIYYKDGDSQQWVDASPDIQPISTDLWTEAGGYLSPKTGTNGVDIGGSKIQLKADGSVIAKTVKAADTVGGQGYVMVEHTGNGQATLAFNASALELTANSSDVNRQNINFIQDSTLAAQIATRTGNFLIGGVLPASPNIKLNANGSAVFLGDVTTESAAASMRITATGAGSYPSLRLKNDAREYHWQIDGNNNSFRLYDQDNATTLFSVQSNGDFYLGGATPGGGSPIFNPNITLAANGSITAAGSAQFGNWDSQASDTEGAFIYSVGSYQANRTSASASPFKSLLNGDITFEVRGDGRVTAAGDITSGNFEVDAVKLYNGGNVSIWRTAGAGTAKSIQSKFGGTETFSVTADGSITAAGAVESTSVAFGFKSSATSFPFTAESRLGNSGKAFFADHTGTGSSSSYLFYGQNSGGEAFSVATNGNITAAGDVKIGGTLPSAPNISLSASGGDIFAEGGVLSSYTRAKRDLSTEQIPLFYGINTNSGSNENVFHVGSSGISLGPDMTYDSGLVNGYTSRIYLDGSAEFAGAITSGSPLIPTATGVGVNVVNNGYIEACRNGGLIFRAFNFGNTTPTSQINADGSASFAGRIRSDEYLLARNKTTQAGLITYNDTGSARTDAAVLISNNSTADGETARINYDGSASFAGQLEATRGIFTDDPGNLAVRTVNSSTNKQNFGASSSGVFIGDDISTAAGNKIALNADGSAEFDGTVTANGSILTRAGGITLDVGDRLEKVDAALTGLKAALVSTTDHASLKAALIAALADI